MGDYQPGKVIEPKPDKYTGNIGWNKTDKDPWHKSDDYWDSTKYTNTLIQRTANGIRAIPENEWRKQVETDWTIYDETTIPSARSEWKKQQEIYDYIQNEVKRKGK